MKPAKWKRRFIIFMLLVVLVFTTLMTLANQGTPEARAQMKMVWGLVILWVFVGGYLMYRLRERVRRVVLALPGGWRTKFVLFAILLACLEEVVTVFMTNLAPEFGVPVGKAFITASANYFDVIFFHSVIVFVPLFIATSSLLKRYAFSPFAIFIIFGLAGTIAEALYAGNFAYLVLFYQWVFVYGLMVYLPAYSIPANRGARPPRWWHYVLAVPYIFLYALPMIAVIAIVIVGVLGHPNVHF